MRSSAGSVARRHQMAGHFVYAQHVDGPTPLIRLNMKRDGTPRYSLKRAPQDSNSLGGTKEWTNPRLIELRVCCIPWRIRRLGMQR